MVSIDALADALREVAPSIDALDQPLQLWRGVMVRRDVSPAEAAINLSWTTSFDVACYFAIIRDGHGKYQERQGGRPFVFTVNVTAEDSSPCTRIAPGGTPESARCCSGANPANEWKRHETTRGLANRGYLASFLASVEIR